MGKHEKSSPTPIFDQLACEVQQQRLDDLAVEHDKLQQRLAEVALRADPVPQTTIDNARAIFPRAGKSDDAGTRGATLLYFPMPRTAQDGQS